MKSITLILTLLILSNFSFAAEVKTDCLAMNETSRVKEIQKLSIGTSSNIKGKGLSQ